MKNSVIDSKIDVSTTVLAGLDKVAHYKWTPAGPLPYQTSINKHDLVLNAPYQREPSPHRVNELRSNWSSRLAGVLIVSYRDGLYYVIDGKHRVLAVLSRSDVEALLCIVFFGLTVEDEARLFEKYNTKKNSVKPLERFRARLIQQDETALIVDALLKEHGLILTNRPTSNRGLKAVVVLENIVARCGEKGLHWVLYVAKRMASLHDDRISDAQLKGLMYVYLRCMSGQESSRREEQLVERLCNIIMADFDKTYRSLKAVSVYKNDISQYYALLQLVNKGLRIKFGQEEAT